MACGLSPGEILLLTSQTQLYMQGRDGYMLCSKKCKRLQNAPLFCAKKYLEAAHLGPVIHGVPELQGLWFCHWADFAWCCYENSDQMFMAPWICLKRIPRCFTVVNTAGFMLVNINAVPNRGLTAFGWIQIVVWLQFVNHLLNYYLLTYLLT